MEPNWLRKGPHELDPKINTTGFVPRGCESNRLLSGFGPQYEWRCKFADGNALLGSQMLHSRGIDIAPVIGREFLPDADSDGNAKQNRYSCQTFWSEIHLIKWRGRFTKKS